MADFGVRFNRIGDRVLLVKGVEAFELDDVAQLMWVNADGERTVREIARAVADTYGHEPNVVETDSVAFFTELESLGLVEAE